VTIANLIDVIAMTSAACDVLETMGDRILMLPATANNGHGPEYNSIVAALDIFFFFWPDQTSRKRD